VTWTGDEQFATLSPPGWFPYGALGKIAEWNGAIWTGARALAPELPAPPKWRRPRSGGHLSWLWLLLTGQIFCLLSALLGAATHESGWVWTCIVGYGVFMVGAMQLAGRFLRFDRLACRRNLVVMGVVSGIVASGAAIGLEFLATRHAGFDATLWLAGPIEELSKLLIPGLLLLFGPARFKDPRTGLFLVLCSAATFGALEGVVWETRTNSMWLHVMLSLVRPGVELLHPFLTGFGAAVIWLAAARAGHMWTKVGTLALVLIVAVHSFHDGIADFLPVPQGQKRNVIEPVVSASQALLHGLGTGVGGWGLSLMFLVLYRHAARELVTPSELATTPPRWRPRIKQWGYRGANYAPHSEATEEATT
jgi:hypothetical protein